MPAMPPVQPRKIQIRLLIGLLLIEPFLILFQGRWRWKWFLNQWGFYPRGTSRDTVWINAVAMGEMKVAVALVQALPETVPVVITCSTQDSLRFAREILGPRAELASVPFPFAFAVRRFFHRFSPRQLILVEATDLRPLLCLQLAQRELPTALVNGWISEKLLKVHRTLFSLITRVHVFGVRGDNDRDLLASLGIPRDRISLTGEFKFDVMADSRPELEAQMLELAGGRPILIAGSTHPSEAPLVLDAFERLGGGDRAMLILAPRIANQRTERLLRERRIGFVKREQFPVSGRPAVILLDQRGELASLYRLAAAALVGGSLSPTGGGHNPIEPARFAVPVATGLHMVNFQFLADLFDRAGAWQRVADAGELAQAWAGWLDNPALARQVGRRAAELVESQQGLATARTLELLRPLFNLDDRTMSVA